MGGDNDAERHASVGGLEAGLGVIQAMTDSLTFLIGDRQALTERARAEAVRYLMRLISGGAIHQLENRDPAYPLLARFAPPLSPFGCPNPDFSYLVAPVHGDHSYRVFGTRGTSRFVGIGTFSGVHEAPPSMLPIDGRIHVIDGRGDLAVGPEGLIDIRLTTSPRAPSDVRLGEGDGIVSVRYAYYDWDGEVPPQIYIEREGAQYPPPAETSDSIVSRLDLLQDFLRDVPRDFATIISKYYATDPRTLPFPPLSYGSPGDEHSPGFKGQSYGQSHYDLGPDEAAVLTVTPPECWYWGFQLTSQFRESSDMHLRPMSINGYQASLDPDGAFRAVIAHRDPGAPNWLDTGGRPTGLVVGRYVGSGTVPEASIRVVPFRRIRDHLDATAPIVTLEERSEQIRRRMHAMHRRGDI